MKLDDMLIDRKLAKYERIVAKAGNYRVIQEAYLQRQADVVFNKKTPNLNFTGGLGGGKTKAGVAWALHRGIINSPHAGLIIEPTFGQIETVFMDTLLNMLLYYKIPRRNIKYDSKSHNLMLKVNGRSFMMLLRSGDRAANIAGSNLAYCLIDEADFVSEDVALQARARVRKPQASLLQTCMVGTPEKVGGWWHKMCEIDPDPNGLWIRAQTEDNYFLPEHYIRNQFGQMPHEIRKQYLNGFWVSGGGIVYKRFDNKKHVVPFKHRPSPEAQFVMACDFGQGFMAWIFGIYQHGTVHFFDEYAEENKDTDQASHEALLKWKMWVDKWENTNIGLEDLASRITVYGDPASSPEQRRSSSDGIIMRMKKFKTKFRKASINVSVRVATLNQALKNDRIMICPKGCPHTLRSIRHQGYKNGAPEKWDPHKGREGLDHANDAMGYLAEFLWQLRDFRGNLRSY